jgi:hypothetical protein
MNLRFLKAHPAEIISPVAFVLQLIVNYCSIFETGNKLFPASLFDVGKKYQTRMWPDMAAFPIVWGAIYLFQFLYICRPFVSADLRKDANILFPITCALNIAWVFCFIHEKVTASLAVFGIFWLTLAALWIRLNVIAPAPRTLLNYLTLVAPFSLCLGWATFDLQLNVSSVVQMYRQSPFTMTDIVICTLAATVAGWLVLAVTSDLMFCAGMIYGFGALLYQSRWTDDRDLTFVMALAISSLGSAAIVRLATNWFRKIHRLPKHEASSVPLEPRIIEA